MSTEVGVDLLVTGGTGYLGTEIVAQALQAGLRVAATHCTQSPAAAGVTWRPLDLRVADEAPHRLLQELRPTAVIHTAGLDRGDEMESVTARGSGRVAAAAAALGARLVHLSSDVVHAGDEDRPYVESDLPRPVSRYGRAKAEAERLVRQACPSAALVRTSLIIGGPARPSKHERLVLDVCDGVAEVRFFSDEIRCPVEVTALAAAALALCRSDHAGPLNVAGADALDRLELARLTAAAFGRDASVLVGALSVDSSEPRPRVLRLDSRLAARLLPVRLRGAREILAGEWSDR